METKHWLALIFALFLWHTWEEFRLQELIKEDHKNISDAAAFTSEQCGNLLEALIP